MIPYDVLFPGLDLVVQHEGVHYWAVDHQLPEAGCRAPRSPSSPAARFPDVRGVGGTTLDLRDPTGASESFDPLAARLSEKLWAGHRDELVRATREVVATSLVSPRQVVVAPSPSPGASGATRSVRLAQEVQALLSGTRHRTRDGGARTGAGRAGRAAGALTTALAPAQARITTRLVDGLLTDIRGRARSTK